jgi:chemotaxis protein MotB
MRWQPALLSILAIFVLTACISRDEHDQLMAEAAHRMRMAQQAHQQQMGQAQTKIVSLEKELEKLKGEITARDKKIEEANRQIATMQAKLDDATALNQQLTGALEKAGKSVKSLVAEKGSLNAALNDTKARLEELRKAQAAANKRAELFKSLLLKFKKMIDAGDLKIVLRDGRMTLQLRNDVLFDSGKVSIKKSGKDALREVAGILVSFEDRKLQVAGHTDNVPISTAQFPSNWELSTARAIQVVKFLVNEGVKPELLSAAGYGEHDPVASNETKDGRAKNRRIEIVLQPNIAELVNVPIDEE